jgi:hypothetical protein
VPLVDANQMEAVLSSGTTGELADGGVLRRWRTA